MAYRITGPEGTVVYCANYRTASTATGATIVGLGGEQLGNHHSVPSDEVLSSKPIVAQTVRHHCDVIASYWYKQGCRIPLEELVDKILGGEDKFLGSESFYQRYPMAGYIIRYPALEIEFQCLMGMIGIQCDKLKRNRSQRPSGLKWQSLFTHKLRTKVLDRYESEIQELGLWQ